MNTKSKENNVKDGTGEVVAMLVEALSSRGAVRLTHFGLFKVVEVKGRKRYNFAERKMEAVRPFKKITFTPAEGLRDMLNRKRERK